jgi:transposase InsO family protein
MRLQGGLSIERMCQLAQVSRAGFYRSFQEQEPQAEEMELRSAIQEIFIEHRRRYGYRRVSKELKRRGWVVNRKRVQRLMQEDNLLAIQPKAFVCTTNSQHKCEVYLNLAQRMKVTGINQLWVADITYIRLQGEFVFLAVILDAYSRKVVGWELSRKLTSELTISALERAITARQPAPGLVHHSDRGVQYAAQSYIKLLEQHQIIPSMSRPANPYDNASCESFMKTLKREEIYASGYHDLEHLRQNLEEFIERYYNSVRLHSSIGYQSPDEFEQSLVLTSSAVAATMSFFRHGEDYRPDAANKIGSDPQATPAIIGIDESSTGYSLASCSPAELASASPVEHHYVGVKEA